MNKYLTYAAYGWMSFSGIAHFMADVASQMLRGKRTAGEETTLYYGLHSAFALGQAVLGLLALYMVWRGSELVGEWPVRILAIAAAIGWLAIAVLSIEYWQPKANAVVLLLLLVATFLVK